jgi:alpha-L-fucosidase
MKASRRLQWFVNARFGMFIHWGLYSVPAGAWGARKDAGEWILMECDIPGRTYEGFARRFHAKKFDAEEWARLAKDAGMKYLVLTTKHHDGFCLFDTKLTDYNVVKATPYGRDPVRAVVRACRRQGLVPCLYYSVKDWHHPEYPLEATWRTKRHPNGYHSFPNPKADYLKYLDYLQGQLRELLTNYGRIGILWFDWGIVPEVPAFRTKIREIARMIRRLQPQCLVNNRFDGIDGDYGTPEQTIPGTRQAQPFETCMTLNSHWGYNRHDQNWKSAATVLRNLVDVVQKGGNYLLNVGPTASGEIPAASRRILRRLGRWLKTNSESIYGAGPSELNTRWLRDVGGVTARPGRLYLHVFAWPKDRRLFLYDWKGKELQGAYLLADSRRTLLRTDVYPRSLMIHLPPHAPDPLDSVVVLKWKHAV